MKVFSVLVLTFSVVTAFFYEDSSEGWFEPQGNEAFNRVRNLDFVDFVAGISKKVLCFVLPETKCSDSSIQYILHNPKNLDSRTELIIGNVQSVKISHFNGSYPTRFIVHGFLSSSEANVCLDLRNALFEVGTYNVICVNWGKILSQKDYCNSQECAPYVGKEVAKMIDFLHKEGDMSFETLLVAGHSLGAHVAGFAGKNVKNGRIHQIIGMDPALPKYDYNKDNERLNENDADYVEAIHTNGGKLGFLIPIGTADFYPNGGESQRKCLSDYSTLCTKMCPSWTTFQCNSERSYYNNSDSFTSLACTICGLINCLVTSVGTHVPIIDSATNLLSATCSHSSSYEYYAEAIRKNNFVTKKCGIYQEAVKKQCSRASSVRMFDPNNINVYASYYVPVNSGPPFGTGQD